VIAEWLTRFFGGQMANHKKGNTRRSWSRHRCLCKIHKHPDFKSRAGGKNRPHSEKKNSMGGADE
jgi:hypothetical protein